MKKILTALAFLGMTVTTSNAFADEGDGNRNTRQSGALTQSDCRGIIENAIAGANATDSDFRPGKKAKMQIACLDRKGEIIGFYSMPDAWVASIDIAKAKAYTAVSISSDENAVTSRTIGLASQPGGPLWQIGNSNRPGTTGLENVKERGIIEFPGGIPLYKNGKLVGGIGVSGDSVTVDETVAQCGAIGYEAPQAIRSNTVLGVPYTTTVCPF